MPTLIEDDAKQVRVEVVVNGKKYTIEHDRLVAMKDIAFTIEVKLNDGFKHTLKFNEGYVLSFDTLTHLLEAVGSQANNMARRVVRHWLAAGHQIKNDRDLEAVHDRYKKTILDKVLNDIILEEGNDARV